MILRKDIRSIKAYVPGKPLTVKGWAAKLNSNENALGVSALAQQAVMKNVKNIFRYPDGSSFGLKKAIATKYGLTAGNIVLGNGSDEIIDIIIKTFCNPGEEILTSEITFVEYEIVARANGFKAITVPLKNFTYDLAGLQNAITKKTKVIFIANPNNPTGTYIGQKALMQFIKKLRADIVLALDEAYIEYADAKDFPDILRLIKNKNIIILRTFSKAYGLAGLRVGYAIAKKEFIAAMEKIRQPFNINFLAQKAAEAALADTGFIKKTRSLILSEKCKLYDAFERLNIEYIPTQANFVMFKTTLDGVALCKKLMEKNVLIRDLKQYGLDYYVRVTIGTPRENKMFLENLSRILKRK